MHVKPDTRAIEALLLAGAILLSAFWWFGDGRYRDQYADARHHHLRQDTAYAPIRSR